MGHSIQEAGWDIVTHIEETENQENVKAALLKAKEIIGRDPELAVCDLSPSMIGGIRDVFGENVVGIDGFHVMQELNNGIRRDLLDFRDNRFKREIRELHAMRDWVSQVQAKIDDGMKVLTAIKKAGTFPKIESSHDVCTVARDFTSRVARLFKHNDQIKFFTNLKLFLDKNEDTKCEQIKQFVQDVRTALPRIRFTSKGKLRVQNVLFKKLKALYLSFRANLEEENTAFYKDHWALFFQPERMTSKRQERLDALLNRYPELGIYRIMTLQVGEIYRLPAEQIDGHQIHDLEECSSFSERLNTSIRTLKKNAKNILRFVDLFKRHPGLSKKCRASTEWFNVRFKHPFKAGNNLVKKERLLARLRTQLHGDVSWRILEAVKV
jgi:hypothetical protein